MKKKKKPEVRTGNHLKQDISMMCLLANENTNGSRKLLKTLGKDDAINHDDLELALAELYKDAKDKREVEKSFADIHPHKKFILKYCETKVAPADPKAETPATPTIEQPTTLQNSLADVNENYHGCCGMSGAAGNSNACGCGSSGFSGADGSTNQSNSNELMVIGMVSIVAILGLVMYMKK